ncbi:putative acetyltransferase [Marmoricola sp. OAE513]|uniref:GNAT family N-acetyltransferase n=1 Tax=Marmoricola sp. OAE513 TaxID=2817894 RepID=UPI001D2A4C53
MLISVEDPARDDISALLAEHLADMFATSPAESVHALDVAGLQVPAVTFWSVRDDDGVLLGCGALKEHSVTEAEIKSMRTTAAARGRGVAATLLAELVRVAGERGYDRLNLETGAEDYFAPARRLYARHGFVECGPFADYVLDPNSIFMTREVRPASPSG